MGTPNLRWTAEEEAALKAGVARYGLGRWMNILKDPEFGSVLKSRSNVDLKDKWRNIINKSNGLDSRQRGRIPYKNTLLPPKPEHCSVPQSTVDEKVSETEAMPPAIYVENKEFASSRKSISRRSLMGAPNLRWTAEEEAALKAGTARYGLGRWMNILKDPEFGIMLKSRSNVDLKDKWRNISNKSNGLDSRQRGRILYKNTLLPAKPEHCSVPQSTVDDKVSETEAMPPAIYVENKEFASSRKSISRRSLMGAPKLRWTTEEEAALKAGTARYGLGKWSNILKDPEFGIMLKSRSNVDLKNKWRRSISNMSNGLNSRQRGRIEYKSTPLQPKPEHCSVPQSTVDEKVSKTEAMPLPIYFGNTEFTSSRKPISRRSLLDAPKLRWTAEEEAALKAGVARYGLGKWSNILKDPEFGSVLKSCSNVDLKDKWSNISVMSNGLGSRQRGEIAYKSTLLPPKPENIFVPQNTVDEKVSEPEAMPFSIYVENTEFASSRKPISRRSLMGTPKRRWTAVEEAALKAGIARYGLGRWMNILKDPEFGSVLKSRSNVNLKDKWKNISGKSNGLGSRQRGRIAYKSIPLPPKPEICSVSQNTVDEKVSETEAMPLAIYVENTEFASSRKPISRLDDLVVEAVSKLKEPRGPTRASIALYIKEQYLTPSNFEKDLAASLKLLTETGRLIKIKHHYRIAPGSASLNAGQEMAPLLLEAGQDSSSLMWNGFGVITIAQIDAELYKMRSMNEQDAAAAAAKAVAEAEAATNYQIHQSSPA